MCKGIKSFVTARKILQNDELLNGLNIKEFNKDKEQHKIGNIIKVIKKCRYKHNERKTDGESDWIIDSH